MAIIYLIRHAQSFGNIRPDIIGGQSNHLQVTSLGHTQIHSLNIRLKEEAIDFDQVFCSTAVRTTETALGGLKEIYDLTKITYSRAFLEKSQGEWEGLEKSRIYTPEIKELFLKSQGHFRPPNGESMWDAAKRYYHKISTTLEEGHKVIGIFGHGNGIKSLISKIENTPMEEAHLKECDNTAITKIIIKDNIWRVTSFADNNHIK
jgi:broad specificity phosphatase PhoE